MSSSLFTNRLLSESFFKYIETRAEVKVWAFELPIFWGSRSIEPFPEVLNNRERINFLRRINEKAWVHAKQLTSIQSMRKFSLENRKNNFRDMIQSGLAKFICLFHLHYFTDRLIRFLVSKQKRSSEARARLVKSRPDMVVVLNPFWMFESAVAIEAKNLGIPVISIIPSWDNITTKSRLTFTSDAYFVWSEIRKDELQTIYPFTRNKPVFLYGTPQYEIFSNQRLWWTKEEFCKRFELDPEKKIILYATGSPNFIKTEYTAAEKFMNAFVTDPQLSQYQLLFRPHPNKDNNELQHLHAPDKNCYVQFTDQAGLKTEKRNLDLNNTLIWINTFRHADVVVNLSSTVILDAIICGKPVVNLNFEMSGDERFDQFIKEINSSWTHLKEVWECEGIPQVSSFEQLKEAIIHALEYPEEGKESREVLLQKICGMQIGNSGAILANKILSFFS